MAMSQEAESGPEATAKELMRTARTATLATLDWQTGGPFASLVGVAADVDHAPLLLISTLARHTKNILRDPRASLLLAGPLAQPSADPAHEPMDPMTAPRLSLVGSLGRSAGSAARAHYLAAHPSASAYIDFADFSLWRFEITQGHLVAGFGRISTLDGLRLLTRLQP